MSYEKELEIWRNSEPIGGTNYDYESWLESKPNPRFDSQGQSR